MIHGEDGCRLALTSLSLRVSVLQSSWLWAYWDMVLQACFRQRYIWPYLTNNELIAALLSWYSRQYAHVHDSI